MADVRMPDGAVIKNVPEGVTQRDLLQRYSKMAAAETPGWKVPLDWLSGVTEAATNVITFGLSDYAAAAGKTVQDLFTSRDADFGRNLEEERRRQQKFSETNPVSALTASVVGGAGAVTPLLGAATRLGRAVAPNTPLLARSITGGTAGGTASGLYGGIQGAGTEQGALEGALDSSVVGSVVGLAAPPLFNVAGRMASSVIQAVTNRLGQGQTLTPGARKIAEAMARDGVTPDRIAARLSMMGPRATLADAGGAGTRELGESMANQPGRSRNLAWSVLGPRSRSQGDEVYAAAQRGLGARGTFYVDIDALNTARRAAADPLYEAAFTRGPPLPAVWSNWLQIMLGDPISQSGIRKGLKIQRIEAAARGERLDPLDYGVTDFNAAGDPIISGTPNLRLLDAAKRGLDAIIEKARDGTTGRINWTEELHAIDAMRRSFVGELDGLTGGANGLYAQARAAWAGPSQMLDAMHMGRRFAKQDEEVTTQIINRMSPDERSVFREGVLRELRTMIGRNADNINVAKKLIRTPNTARVLEATFPDRPSWNRFQMTAMTEDFFAETKNQVLAGPASARRIAAAEDSKLDPGPLVDLAQGSYFTGVRGLVNQAWSAVGKGLPVSVRDDIGRMLFSRDPIVQQRALTQLRQRAQFNQVSQQALDGLTALLGAESAYLAGQSAAPRVGQSP